MSKSEQLFSQAKKFIPGGVNSPVRSFSGVGGSPLFIDRALGAYLYDVDGRSYIDYVGSWGPMILGHNHPAVMNAVRTAVANGLSFGAPTELEIKLAQKVCELVESVELVRMVNSGTEATMSALRLARAFTDRKFILKFEGCYHGHADAFLVKAGSGALTLGKPTSPGVPQDVIKHTLIATYNDLDSVVNLFEQYGDDIAAIIVEPVAGNMNCIPPVEGFLSGLREICDQYSSLLIFDEVMTGFRVALGGAQTLYGIKPDLSTFGKVIGGGMPVGAFGGKKEVMEQVAPLGPVYQAGTLSGNPVAMAAGLQALTQISEDGFFENLGQKTNKLVSGIRHLAEEAQIPFSTNQVGAMFGLFFSKEEKVENFQQVCACDIERFKTIYHQLLNNGIYMAPSAYEAGFVSSAHHDNEIELTLEAFSRVFQEK